MKAIVLSLKYVGEFFQRNGIAWMRHINENLKWSGNWSEFEVNKTLADYLSFQACHIILRVVPSFDVDFRLTFEKRFADEDFCLFKAFPFEQLVFIEDDLFRYWFDMNVTKTNATRHGPVPTCTFLWLVHLYPIYKANKIAISSVYKNDVYAEIFKVDIGKCGFEKRLEKCNSSNFEGIIIIYFLCWLTS